MDKPGTLSKLYQETIGLKSDDLEDDELMMDADGEKVAKRRYQDKPPKRRRRRRRRKP